MSQFPVYYPPSPPTPNIPARDISQAFWNRLFPHDFAAAFFSLISSILLSPESHPQPVLSPPTSHCFPCQVASLKWQQQLSGGPNRKQFSDLCFPSRDKNPLPSPQGKGSGRLHSTFSLTHWGPHPEVVCVTSHTRLDWKAHWAPGGLSRGETIPSPPPPRLSSQSTGMWRDRVCNLWLCWVSQWRSLPHLLCLCAEGGLPLLSSTVLPLSAPHLTPTPKLLF